MLWPELMALWTRMERPFLCAPYEQVGRWPLRTKIRMTAISLLVVTVGEYMLQALQKTLSHRRRFSQCGWSTEKMVERYFLLDNQYIFERIPYSTAAAVIKTVCDIVREWFSGIYVITQGINFIAAVRHY